MKRRVLVIGAGFAGMWSALGAARLRDLLGKADDTLEIALVAPEPFLHVRPRFYETDFAAMRAPLGALFEAAGIRYVQGLAERIDCAASQVEVVAPDGTASALPFDRLVLAAGSRLFRPDIPGLREHGFSVDQLHEAQALDAHLRALADLPDTPGRNTIVIVGGGFTGIETAAEMPARLKAIFGPAAEVDVLILEQAGAIGPDLGPGPRPVIEQALRSQGVSWRLNSAVRAIDAEGVVTSRGARIAARTVIWTAGLRASALTLQVPGPRDGVGRLHVDRDLRVIGAANVFATGDTAHAATDDLGNPALMSCQHAMNLGRSAGHNAAADLLGVPALPYSQPKYVTCLDLGPWGAVYTEGWERAVKLTGAEAKQLKRQINTEWIYPPRADRAELFAAADPARLVVA